MSLTRKLEPLVPHWANCALTSAYGKYRGRRRWSGSYQKWFDHFRDREFHSRAELEAYQEEKLRALIAHVYDHVAFYREIMDKRGLTPKDIQTLADLPKLPIIDKDMVRVNNERIISDDVDPKTLIVQKTGGSTGAPLTLRWSRDQEHMQNGFIWARSRRHVATNSPSALFTGRNLHLGANRIKPPYWIDNWADNQRLLSIFHLSEKTLDDYVCAVDERRCAFITGYQSAWGMLAKHMLATGQTFSEPIGHYYASSEMLQDDNRAAIEQAFGCQVWNHYGLGELVAAITEYDCGHLHVDMDYSIVEFIPEGEEDGLTLARVIGTRMHDLAWPLIRYDTGDLVLIDPKATCDVRHSPVIHSIYGRTGAFLELPDGRRINNITSIIRQCKNFREAQAAQHPDGTIDLRIVPTDAFNEEDEQAMLATFANRLGADAPIRVVRVDAVEKTRGGKAPSILKIK